MARLGVLDRRVLHPPRRRSLWGFDGLFCWEETYRLLAAEALDVVVRTFRLDAPGNERPLSGALERGRAKRPA
jgi:hypothetical protein